MGLEELREAVLRRAREEAERIILSARESARKVLEEARAKKEALVEAEKRRLLSEVNYEARVAEAKLRARLLVSKARADLVEKVMSKALELLRNMPAEKRSLSLRRLLEESIKEAENSLSGELSRLFVYVSRADLELAREIVEELASSYGIELELRVAEISGGVVVEDPEGRVTVDNSFDSRASVLVSRLSRSLIEGAEP